MVRFIKFLAFCLAILLASPLIILAWVEKHLLRTEGVFLTAAQLVAPLAGPVGTYVRSAFYFGALDQCSWEVHVGYGTLFTHRGAKLASRVSTGAYCVIGHARLGAGVRLASRVSIPSGKRQHFDAAGHLSDASHFDEVAVGEGCWVGEGAIIMADIGSGSVVSAGAVVVKPMPAHQLIAGNPAHAQPAPSASDCIARIAWAGLPVS